MKLFKYDQFINESNESREDIDSICAKYGITNYTINSDGSIDVDGNVDLFGKSLTKLPLKFNHVSGNFNCGDNKLTSLEGCPKSVGVYFTCSYNKLTSLIGGPEKVGGNKYSCYNNQLIDFYGFPEDWEGKIKSYNNPCQNILSLFPIENRCRAIDLLNELEVIQGAKVSELRLEEVYRLLKVKFPKNLKIYGYEII
jgi:hypothetical protein